MEARINRLEDKVDNMNERLTSLERDVAVIKSNYATKADISEAKNSIIAWVVGALFLAPVLPTLLRQLGFS